MYYAKQAVFEDDLMHAVQKGGQRANHKYVGRVSTGNGWRYFYNSAEMQAYGKAAGKMAKSASANLSKQYGNAKKFVGNMINKASKTEAAKSARRALRQTAQKISKWAGDVTGYNGSKTQNSKNVASANADWRNNAAIERARKQQKQVKKEMLAKAAKKGQAITEAKKAYDRKIIEDGEKLKIKNRADYLKKDLANEHVSTGQVRNVKDEAKISDRKTGKELKNKMNQAQIDLQTKKVANVKDLKKKQATKERQNLEKFVRDQNKKGKQYEDYLQYQDFKKRQKETADKQHQEYLNSTKQTREVGDMMREQEKKNNQQKAKNIFKNEYEKRNKTINLVSDQDRFRDKQESSIYATQKFLSEADRFVKKKLKDVNDSTKGTTLSRKTGSAAPTMTGSMHKAKLKQLKKKYLNG